MIEKKYKLLTNDTIDAYGYTLYRIKALKDFGYVHKGDIGGYIEKEDNLSHIGDCWVYGNAKVFGDAIVFGNAKVYDNVRVYGYALVYDNAIVYGNAKVYDNAVIFDNARVFGNAKVYDNAIVFGDALVYGNARVYGNAKVYDNADISSNDDYALIQGFGSENRCTTFFKCKDGHIHVKCGCFNGTLDKFEEKVKETHGDNKYGREYLLSIQLIKTHFVI